MNGTDQLLIHFQIKLKINFQPIFERKEKEKQFSDFVLIDSASYVNIKINF